MKMRGRAELPESSMNLTSVKPELRNTAGENLPSTLRLRGNQNGPWRRGR